MDSQFIAKLDVSSLIVKPSGHDTGPAPFFAVLSPFSLVAVACYTFRNDIVLGWEIRQMPRAFKVPAIELAVRLLVLSYEEVFVCL